MSRLTAFIKAKQLSLDDIEAITGGDGLCPNRMLCMIHRLNVSFEAVMRGHRCAFEEHDALWQCHLSGVARMMEVEN